MLSWLFLQTLTLCNELSLFFFKGMKEMFYLTTHSTHFIYGYMASDMVKDHSAREETDCRHMGYTFWLAARILLYASSHRQDNTYHSLCFQMASHIFLHWEFTIAHMSGCNFCPYYHLPQVSLLGVIVSRWWLMVYSFTHISSLGVYHCSYVWL